MMMMMMMMIVSENREPAAKGRGGKKEAPARRLGAGLGAPAMIIVYVMLQIPPVEGFFACVAIRHQQIRGSLSIWLKPGLASVCERS